MVAGGKVAGDPSREQGDIQGRHTCLFSSVHPTGWEVGGKGWEGQPGGLHGGVSARSKSQSGVQREPMLKTGMLEPQWQKAKMPGQSRHKAKEGRVWEGGQTHR